MSDDLDARLARLAHTLVAEAPEAPSFDQLTLPVAGPTRRSRRPRYTGLVVAAAVVLIAIVIAVSANSGTSDREEPAGPTEFAPCTVHDPGFFVGRNGQTFGPMVAPPEGGTVTAEDIAASPDYQPVACQTSDTIGGWIKKADIFGTGPVPTFQDGPLNVYADDGTTIVGSFGDGGFVKLGEEPRASVTTTTVTPTTAISTP